MSLTAETPVLFEFNVYWNPEPPFPPTVESSINNTSLILYPVPWFVIVTEVTAPLATTISACI